MGENKLCKNIKIKIHPSEIVHSKIYLDNSVALLIKRRMVMGMIRYKVGFASVFNSNNAIKPMSGIRIILCTFTSVSSTGATTVIREIRRSRFLKSLDIYIFCCVTHVCRYCSVHAAKPFTWMRHLSNVWQTYHIQWHPDLIVHQHGCFCKGIHIFMLAV